VGVRVPSAALIKIEKSSKSLKINRFSEIFLFPETYEKGKMGQFYALFTDPIRDPITKIAKGVTNK